MEYILIEDHVKFVTFKLKGRAVAWWNQLQNIRMYQTKPPTRTWWWMKLLQAHSFTLEAEEMVIQPPPVMRSYRSNKTTESQQKS